jgi:outer membrane protein insertion porin family/translocation and assembly module TamA
MHAPKIPWALLLSASLAPGLFAQGARKEQDVSPEVRRLTFKGVDHVDVNDLAHSISTRATRCKSIVLKPFCLASNSPTFKDKYYLDRDELRRDMLRIRLFYWKSGYREADVDTTVTRTGTNQVAVTFTVKEGPPTVIRTIAVDRDTSLISNRTLGRLMLLHPKDPLDLTVLDSMRVLFQNELWDRGYGDGVADTTVVVDTATRLADVRIKLIPNRVTTVGKITVAGNDRIDETTIRNTITFKSGDLYKQSEILESQRNLYESNLFRLAAISVGFQPDSVKNVNIDVTEAPLHEARIGPGLNNIDFAQFQVHYTAYSLFGGARRLDVDGTVGNLFAPSLQGRGFFRDVAAEVPDSNVSPYLQPTYVASIDLKQPAFLGRAKDAASVGVFSHRSINPGVFIDHGFGGQATLTHEFLVRAPGSLTYRYEENRVEASDVFFCVNYGVCDVVTINTLRGRRSLSPLAATGFIDRSDLPFSPTKGYLARLDFEYASSLTLSDYQYDRVAFDAAVYGHRSRTKQVYSAHLRAGFVHLISTGSDNGVLHPRKRFYAGGANSVRGFNENQMGPRILTIPNDTTLLNATTSLPGGTCAFTITAVKFCDPNAKSLSNSDFVSQPTGGTSLLEASVEYRFPLTHGESLRNWVGAVFVDGGIVGRGDIAGLASIGGIVKGMSAITPGFGVRYLTAVGPIRVDIGINPNRAEELGVVTSVPNGKGQMVIVPLAVPRLWTQGHTLLSRLVLHFSIGEAY